MPGPRYVPRAFCDDPSAFGRDAGVTWKQPESLAASIQTHAARLQHQFVLRMRERLSARRMPTKEFSARAGTTAQRLSRIMRGEIPIRLEDLAAADLILGEITEPARRAAERDKDRLESEQVRVEAIVRATLAALGVPAARSTEKA